MEDEINFLTIAKENLKAKWIKKTTRMSDKKIKVFEGFAGYDGAFYGLKRLK